MESPLLKNKDTNRIDLLGEPNKLLSAFSMLTHGSKLFELKEVNSPNVINCLNGIRTLSVFWIVLGHRFNSRFEIPVLNLYSSWSFVEKIHYLIYTNYDKPVDSFFVIGGLLVTWTLMTAFDKYL